MYFVFQVNPSFPRPPTPSSGPYPCFYVFPDIFILLLQVSSLLYRYLIFWIQWLYVLRQPCSFFYFCYLWIKCVYTDNNCIFTSHLLWQYGNIYIIIFWFGFLSEFPKSSRSITLVIQYCIMAAYTQWVHIHVYIFSDEEALNIPNPFTFIFRCRS